MDFDIISQLVGSLGFPIFVAVWMLMKNSKDSENITNALKELREAIVLLTAKNESKRDSEG